MRVGDEAVTVVYRNGEPDFTPYAKAAVKIACTGNRGVDARRANAALWKTENRQPPRGCVRHHTADGMTIQWVPKEIHEKFSHEGFVVKIKRLKKNADNSMEY
ncbi:MAG: HNH endonuclease [Clostridia bacterium]|nr:HNH endonuclease [Clostridia bacterium]